VRVVERAYPTSHGLVPGFGWWLTSFLRAHSRRKLLATSRVADSGQWSAPY
jgi:hypothetical protein